MKVIELPQEVFEAEASLVDWAQLRRLMEFQDLTYPSLARLSGTPLSTLRKLMQGATADPRLSSILPVCRALGASLDRLIGLAPKRDLEREEAVYDSSLMDNMRNQLEAAEEQRDADARELDRLRKLVLAKGEACSHAEARLLAAESVIRDKDASITRRDAIIVQRDAEIDDMANRIDNQSVRLESKAQRIQDQAEQISRQTAMLESRDTTIKHLEAMYERRGRRARILGWALAIVSVVSVAAIAYLVWEILNLDKGITAELYKELLQK